MTRVVLIAATIVGSFAVVLLKGSSSDLVYLPPILTALAVLLPEKSGGTDTGEPAQSKRSRRGRER